MKVGIFRNGKKTVLTGVFCVVVGSMFGVIWLAVGITPAQENKKAISEIRISVIKQEGSPLDLSADASTVTDAFRPAYSYLVTNNSTKVIRAYTVRSEALLGVGNSALTGWDLNHLVAASLLLKPHKSLQEFSDGNTRYPDNVTEIKLSVDFVEFDDGTTWGRDSARSVEILAGERAGGMAMIDHFRRKLASNALTADSISDEVKTILASIDQDASSNWKRGFQTGVGLVRNRLLKALQNAGADGVRSEISKPFDASMGRQQP